MKTLVCNVLKRQYTVKKICKRSEMPNSADYYYTAYCLDGMTYDIYRTPAGILYAKINTI